MDIYLDLSQSATRATLLNALLGLMTPDQRTKYEDLLKRTTVPEKHHHNILEVNETINSLAVDEELKEQLRGVYSILASAEAEVHGCSVDETHFHEVGNAFGIRNALAICAAFYVLNPERITASAVQTGSGQIQCAHGLMDVPAPATAEILRDIPRAEPLMEGELCTPTSAAIIKYYVQEFAE